MSPEQKRVPSALESQIAASIIPIASDTGAERAFMLTAVRKDVSRALALTDGEEAALLSLPETTRAAICSELSELFLHVSSFSATEGSASGVVSMELRRQLTLAMSAQGPLRLDPPDTESDTLRAPCQSSQSAV